MSPYFSIIIPVYNVEQYLRECLNSIVSQSFDDYEVICVNDGSIDGSLAVLRYYEANYKNITVIDSLNGGTASARNIGIDAASGEYIWFVDSDDWIERNALQLLFEKSKNECLDIFCFNGKLINEKSGKEEQDKGFENSKLTGWQYYNKYAIVAKLFHFVCVVLRLYRREFILENKLYFEKGILYEDNLWIPIVMFKAQLVAVIPDSLYIYRIREGSKMQSQSFRQIIDTINVANKLSDFFIPINGIDKSQLYREIAGEYFRVYMPENLALYSYKYEEIKERINWINFKKVCVYPRHRRIYVLLSIHPFLFRLYIWFEKHLKKII